MLKPDKTKIGDGYGSECHLLRYMGRHRRKLDGAILSEMGLTRNAGWRIEWLDFRFDPKKRKEKWYDAELEGLDFLEGPGYKEVRAAWKQFWPQSGTSQNWDAVGWLVTDDGSRTLLLVEAKAHTRELKSRGCGATGNAKKRIVKALAETIEELKASNRAEDWCGEYYQYANRLATLHFLYKNNVPARLVLVYFCGDKFPEGDLAKGDECPEDENGWKKALAEQNKYLGLPNDRPPAPYVRKIFLSVTG